MRRTRPFLVAVSILLGGGAARAGMPSITIADVRQVLVPSKAAGMRLEVISFFVIGFLVLAGVVRLLWNGLRKDFSFLPRLSYPRAVGLLTLWGLLFVLILTMISGARELMTPGAWKKDGPTYRLAPSPAESGIARRCEAIGRLRDALLEYADRHGGAYPGASEVSDELWVVPGPGGRRYVYRGGRRPGPDDFRSGAPVAYEPDAVGADRLVIFADGVVAWMPEGAIR